MIYEIKEKVEKHAKVAESIMDKIIWGQFPPPTVNNSRAIARNALQRLHNAPSEANAQKVESIIEGVSVDVHEVLGDREVINNE